MEQRIKGRFSAGILAEARERFEIEKDRIHLLDGFESFMFEFERPNGEFILRLAHSLRRTLSLIQAEVDWINYLAAGGATVARAVCSRRGRLVEEIEDGQGGRFLATAFIKAGGAPAAMATSKVLLSIKGATASCGVNSLDWYSFV